jgi:hypothetical protein
LPPTHRPSPLSGWKRSVRYKLISTAGPPVTRCSRSVSTKSGTSSRKSRRD